MSVKIIDKKIGQFVTNRDKLKKLGHDIAVLIFDHALAHGDCTRAIKLASAFPNSWQPQIEAWFKAFSPIRVVIKNNKCEFDPAYKKALAANKPDFWNREAAVATPFYDLIEEPTVSKTLDFAALVALVTGLGKRIEKKIEENAVAPEDVASARAIAERVKALKFDRIIAEPEKKPADNDEAEGDRLLKAVNG